MHILLVSAIVPVIILCFYIYRKDPNREPISLLIKLFGFGILIIIPALVLELLLGGFFPVENVNSFYLIFINVFIGVALVEEGLKWLIVKRFGYNHNEFDEVYDIIVYAVFVSLGFACLENIVYVLDKGIYTAFVRALLAIPGHACFAIMMGYFLSKAKVASVSNNNNLVTKNMFLSILVPILLHTTYDALIFYYVASELNIVVLIFILFHVTMVVFCFVTVGKISKMQQNIKINIDEGNIINKDGQIRLVETSTPLNFCPVCGHNVAESNYCGRCGFKLK